MGLTYVLLMVLPFSIAFFYQKVFKKEAYPYFFLISGVFFIIYFYIYYQDIFNIIGTGFFAAGGIVLAATSIRLYLLMMEGE
ncbi:MAG: hypothetical protein OIN83_06970 [Candidatus Methanoperedens sp.]|nr:hypothetical protein [Candidatus Methanoperedens sp.]